MIQIFRKLQTIGAQNLTIDMDTIKFEYTNEDFNIPCTYTITKSNNDCLCENDDNKAIYAIDCDNMVVSHLCEDCLNYIIQNHKTCL